MTGKPRTLTGQAYKLYRMKGRKFAVRVLGWKTPRSGGTFGMTVPNARTYSFSAIPKSAEWVMVVMVETSGRPSRPIKISRSRLAKEFYIG